MSKILAIDPSGNFHEGQGTTGWCLMNSDCKVEAIGQVRAKDFETQYEYWDKILRIINDTFQYDFLVIEDYRLYKHKASSQINSKMETPRLLGVIEYCSKREVHYQMAAQVKQRWKDELLCKKGYLTKRQHKSSTHYYLNGLLTTPHMRDAIRHAIHFIKFKLKELK